ncbi:cryptochrome-1-like [Lytechinus variegatus]|uniref:cryptochrome-1-like n=1 Tax=Lytechinus variegatus TaxID=7654 RepID=UPI001BB162FB|nr:cryptochrome-1-like [Lytechinus variegatus]XP_041452602.1 cryptochrome-1-like [Lytechinus variegatus]
MPGGACIHWFRHGLRLHDNPALLEGMTLGTEFYPIFIFDNEVAGTSTSGFNRWRFLHDCLADIDEQLKAGGGRLFVFQGDPCHVFKEMFLEWGVRYLTFESDPEPIWTERDCKVKALCKEMNVECIERVSHTLWNPDHIIEKNGGTPPITYSMFMECVTEIGHPPRPMPDPIFTKVKMNVLADFEERFSLPSLEALGVRLECPEQEKKVWKGGETRALELFRVRILHEEEAFKGGYCLPNQYMPDLLGTPKSLSAYLRFGCLSVRKFYWKIHDTYSELKNEVSPSHLTAQVIWREYFYTMSVGNIHFNKMKENPICLNIEWKKDDEKLEAWTEGRTGYPWIDACMKQLKYEGWIHQVGRHATACFLTRGDLWISWEDGLRVFDKYLLDADWSICAGNWMWISSSAFEKFLQCPNCFCPVRYGRRMDPTGEYVRRYLPVLKDMPIRYLFEPWKAPRAVQERAKCIVGKDYPMPIVEHKSASAANTEQMEKVINRLRDSGIVHCAPSTQKEVREFVWLPEKMAGGGSCRADQNCEGILGL